MLKNFGTIVGAIVLTGIVLAYAGRGKLGSAARSVANLVTEGYGDFVAPVTPPAV